MTTTANLQLYEQSAIQFLQTCTIIFSPLATQINNNLLASGIAVDQTNPNTWKYYLNVSGEYHSSDTMMTILSLDTKTTVNFTKEMLASSPMTQEAYVVGSSYYAALCQAYPAQIDLIKSIVYPVSIQDAIDAPDFTLLGWGDGYLEATEQDAIIYELQSFIQYAATRWYYAFLSYEAYYTWAFWGCFWQALPNAIFAARLKYLHTSSAHSFHIWSYLESRGIGDYSDILTSQQALFLYRNLGYLIQNRGKQSNLTILVDNLLNSLNVGLVGKTVYMNTATKATTCAWTPEFVSSIIPTINSQSLELIPPESMATLNTELIAAGLEVNNTTPYVEAQETRIGLTPLNILKTKLVEIQKLGVDQKYGSLLNVFILDTLVYGITSGLYAPSVNITDPTTGINTTLSGKDALILYYYAVHRINREQPTLLPTVYTPTCAFKPNITAASFPGVFNFEFGPELDDPIVVYDKIEYYLENIYPTARQESTAIADLIQFDIKTQPLSSDIYPTQSYLPIDMMIEGLGYPSSTIRDPEIFATLVANLFVVLIRFVRYSRTESSMVSLEMFLDYCSKYVFQNEPYTFTLSTVNDYTSWAETNKLTTLLSTLDANANYTDAYTSLSTVIATALLPEDNPIYTFFAYTNSSVDDVYDRLRSLFVQLCSYNIAFLDTSRVNSWWFLFNKVVYFFNAITDEKTLNLDCSLADPIINQRDTLQIQGVSLDREISVSSKDTIEIPIVNDTMIKLTQNMVRPIHVPLTITIGTPSMTDTTIIPSRNLLQTAVVLPS